MNRRSSTLHRWFEILASAALMGCSTFIAMLALDYLVTGAFSAVRQYLIVALLITLIQITLQWRRYCCRQYDRRSHTHHPHPRA